jgi:hypothetical protein
MGLGFTMRKGLHMGAGLFRETGAPYCASTLKVSV